MTVGRSRAALALLGLLLGGCRAGMPTVGPSAERTMRPAGEPGRLISVAHRGASGHAPENTLPAFDRSLELGADYLELDVYMSRDGVPMVIHDPTLDRTARGPAACRGEVAERTAAELRACEAGSWFNAEFPDAARPEFARGVGVPTLEEVFQRYGLRTNYLVEIKQPQKVPGVEEAVLRLYDRYGLRRAAAERWQVVTQSFSEESVRKMHALAPDLPLIQLLGRETTESILARLPAIRGYAIGIGPAKNTVDPAVVRAAHDHCLLVVPYTVNDPAEMTSLLAMGVDGIITNFPDRLHSVMGDDRRRTARC